MIIRLRSDCFNMRANISELELLFGPKIHTKRSIAFNQNEDALYIASIGKVEVRTSLPNNNNNNIHLTEPVPGIIQILE